MKLDTIYRRHNIVPFPKPNKDKGTSYSPISLLSEIADSREEPSFLLTANTHNTVTTLHTNVSTCANNHCSTRYEQSFRHKIIDTLIRKLIRNSIPGTMTKFIANYIKEHKVYTTYRNHTSIHRQFKTRWCPLTPENELTFVADYKRCINCKHQICHCLGKDVLTYKTLFHKIIIQLKNFVSSTIFKQHLSYTNIHLPTTS